MRQTKLLHLDTNFLLAVALLALAGCSGTEGRQHVTGTVTLDGRPLLNGSINFRPAHGNPSNGSGGLVKDGKFKLPAAKGLKPGKYLVTVQAFKETGRMIDDLQMGSVPEFKPVNFNEAGTLEASVAAGTSNRFDFQLTSAQKRGS